MKPNMDHGVSMDGRIGGMIRMSKERCVYIIMVTSLGRSGGMD
jgi:hypothetical protein